ncbi:UNVERIFIED_CONTAM: hypothetical protein Sindi_3124900 [Sesamum indicum]
MGSPLASAGSAQLPRHAVGARCPPRSGRRRSAGISTARALAAASIRAGPRPEPIGGPASRRSTSDRGASPAPIRFPPDNFKHSLTLFSKSFSSFPSRYLFAIGLSPVFSLGRNLPPDWGWHSQTTRLADSASWCGRGPGTTGLSPSPAPLSQGTWARSAAEDASPDYNSDSEAARFSSWAVPGSLAVTRGILRVIPPDLGSRSEALAPFGTRVERSTTTGRDEPSPRDRIWADRARVRTGGQCPPPRDGRGGDAMRDAQADVPWPNGFGRNLRSKTRWFTGFCNSHQVSHFATFFIDARAEISVAESRFDIRETSPPPVHPRTGPPVRRTLRSVFLGACRAGGSLARTSSAFARAGGGGDRTGAFAPRPGPDFICNVFAVCFCRFRQ